MLPPAGKCRIWMDGVPAAQQPAATDCTTALRQRPTNGTILYGPASRETGGGRFDPSVGERTPSRSAAPSERLERGGSKAEQELKRRRDEQEREKRAAESRERYERARQDEVDRTRLMSVDRTRPRPANAQNGEGSTGSTTKTPPPEKPPAGPAKKKPE